MAEFEVGKVVCHPEHGDCTVTFVGDERVGVQLPSGGHALFRKIDFSAEAAAARKVRVASGDDDARPNTWPANTFVPETLGAEHFMASHWEPFVEEYKEIAKRLPEFVAKGQLLRGFGSFYQAPHPEPENWRVGWHMAWPNHEGGVIVTAVTTGQRHEVMSFYPFIAQGTEISVTLEHVTVWEGQVEAQVRASWQDIPLAFFDTHFLVNRAWYESGEQYAFILRGIAYAAKSSEIFELPFTPNPDQVAWERALAEQRGEVPREPAKSLSIRGMATLMPVSGWDIDEYSFRGPIKSVVEVNDILGQNGWRVRLTVLRSGDDDLDLDVLITSRAWGGVQAPEIGQDIEGQLWLQGHLWSAQRWVEGH